MNDLKIYKDSKEIPFWNYKRILQTGDYSYLIVGNNFGGENNINTKLLEETFNEIVEDFTLSINSKSEEIVLYGNYLSTTITLSRLNLAYNYIRLLINIETQKKQLDVLDDDISDSELIKDLLEGIKIERSDDKSVQLVKILDKINACQNKSEDLKMRIAKIEENGEFESDLDKQFINVCLGLEMHVDERLITLYQFGLLVKSLVEKIEALNRLNEKK